MMRRYDIEHGGQITSRERELLPPETIDELTDRIQDELLLLPDARDPDVTSTLTNGEVHITLWLEAENSQAALIKAGAVIRSALHAASIYTPEWEPLDKGQLVESEKVDWQEANWRITTETHLVGA